MDRPEGLPYWRLSSFYFFYFAVLGMMVPYWPVYLDFLGYSAGWIGVISALVMSTKIIAPNLWGWLADHTGRRLSVIRIGSFFAFVAFSAILFDQRLAVILPCVFFYSFFWNAVLAQFEVVTLDHLGGRAEIYSRIRLWGSIGFILAVVGLGYIFEVASVALFPVLLVGGLLLIWLSSLYVSETIHKDHQQEVNVERLFSLVRQPQVYLFFLVCFLMQFSHGPYYTFFSLYLEGHGYNNVQIGLLWALGVFAEVILFWYMHRLLPRWGLPSIILLSLMLTTLRWLLIALFPENGFVIIAAQCLHAFSFGSFHAVAIEQVRRLFRGRMAGRGQALYSSLSFGAGSASGALISGYYWSISPMMVFLGAALVSLVATAVALVWKNT